MKLPAVAHASLLRRLVDVEVAVLPAVAAGAGTLATRAHGHAIVDATTLHSSRPGQFPGSGSERCSQALRGVWAQRPVFRLTDGILDFVAPAKTNGSRDDWAGRSRGLRGNRADTTASQRAARIGERGARVADRGPRTRACACMPKGSPEPGHSDRQAKGAAQRPASWCCWRADALTTVRQWCTQPSRDSTVCPPHVDMGLRISPKDPLQKNTFGASETWCMVGEQRCCRL